MLDCFFIENVVGPINGAFHGRQSAVRIIELGQDIAGEKKVSNHRIADMAHAVDSTSLVADRSRMLAASGSWSCRKPSVDHR